MLDAIQQILTWRQAVNLLRRTLGVNCQILITIQTKLRTVLPTCQLGAAWGALAAARCSGIAAEGRSCGVARSISVAEVPVDPRGQRIL
jgi:hypothetical protein